MKIYKAVTKIDTTPRTYNQSIQWVEGEMII